MTDGEGRAETDRTWARATFATTRACFPSPIHSRFSSAAFVLLRWAAVSVVGLHTPSPNDVATLPLEVWCQCCALLCGSMYCDQSDCPSNEQFPAGRFGVHAVLCIH